ncbi:hypothetical protein CEUSTIGMA_g4206.t1 [Chlamydomonas eustigma]|uniref:Uncharacterized protein n=1 Tax=Chlamydomonas eustigma TaxID=1157962 RepID=A0A250X1E5_9CHLO|nr:hypothetical protein CEUSTIGMA_g4206.t1 [Chlamydomonas eustigma]|eukprot:GAX76759.1 hypothetical protein CEUSTIGMA_g4206.t1 [Chlamydomonas eustigma]
MAQAIVGKNNSGTQAIHINQESAPESRHAEDEEMPDIAVDCKGPNITMGSTMGSNENQAGSFTSCTEHMFKTHGHEYLNGDEDARLFKADGVKTLEDSCAYPWRSSSSFCEERHQGQPSTSYKTCEEEEQEEEQEEEEKYEEGVTYADVDDGTWAENNVFSEDEGNEENEQDTTADQLRQGRDIQGIPWDRLNFSRSHYRTMRLRSYRNYTNVLPEEASEYRSEIVASANPTNQRSDGRFYDFTRNSRRVQSTIVHFQLRNLVWSTSRNDVYVVDENCVQHWNSATRELHPVLDLSGGHKARRLPGLGSVQVSTMCVHQSGLLAVGGFHGEMVCLRLHDLSVAFSGRVSRSENGITNGIEICDHLRGQGTCVITSNNDCVLRALSAETFQVTSQVEFQWAVNYAVAQPGGGSSVVAVVGDHEVAQLVDMNDGGAKVAALEAHRDYSFAVAWHPDGNLIATGNQDTSAAIWDIRKVFPTSGPVARLVGKMGAIRSLRFSPDGRFLRFLAMAEPADFVHVYDVKAGYQQVQHVDLFGEIAGIAFSPHSDAFFVGIADVTYSSLLEFERHHD